MTNALKLASVSALALLVAAPAFAQADITGTTAVDDRITDITDNVADDFARSEDAARFGNAEPRQGLSGSMSLAYSGKTSSDDGSLTNPFSNDSQDLTLGARLNYGMGRFNQTLGLAIEFAEANGTSSQEDVYGVYDATYSFNDRFYGFGLGRFKTDGIAQTTLVTDPATGDVTRFARTKTDAFLGFGPGYRIVNTDDMAWRVQAGVGVSYLKDTDDNSQTETGYIASSRFFYRINDNVFITDDLDILKSDSALRATNDLGLNVKMTDAFSTRLSYLTDYNDNDGVAGGSVSENKVGVSVVYGF